MRLEVGAVREMHWHLSAEWAYVLKGDLRVSTVTADGDVWLDDVVRFLFFSQIELSFYYVTRFFISVGRRPLVLPRWTAALYPSERHLS